MSVHKKKRGCYIPFEDRSSKPGVQRENFAMYVDLLQNWRVTPESHWMDSVSDENFQSFNDRIIIGFG